jgi:hypothetical protein
VALNTITNHSISLNNDLCNPVQNHLYCCVPFDNYIYFSVGHCVLSVNGIPAEGRYLQDGREILDVLSLPENFPINIRFGRQKLSTNEKIMLASMFHS